MSAQPTPDDEVRSLRRGLAFYRVATLLLLAFLGYLGFRFATHRTGVSDFGEPGTTWTVDLAERHRLANVEHAEHADFSETYFEAPNASVHMHFMGHLQTTPMHLHPRSTEMVVIAGGTAEVTHAWGQAGAIGTRTWTHPAGSLIASPRFTAHEWHNPDDTAMLANLVFTAPRFAGNFYVHADDPRVLQGTEPYAARPAEDLAAFAATGEASRLREVPETEGRMQELLVATTWTLPANPGRPVIAYVFGGRGEVGGQVLGPSVLAHVEGDAPTTIRAEPGAPLALALFDPERVLGAPVATGP